MKTVVLAAMAALGVTGAARAEVAGPWESGFTSRNVVEITARSDRVYAALGEIGRWWSNDHTYSGSASNMTLPLKAGACFCETWPAGGIVHGTVVLAWPARGMLRIDAALGPLQQMGGSGALTWEIKPKGDGVVEVIQTYAVSGLPPAVAKGAAAGVDGVMRDALQRFERYVETGKP